MDTTFQEAHQEEICASRVGGFGGSDAAMFYKVGNKGLGALAQTDLKRIMVAKGIEQYNPIPCNEAMRRGHDFEEWFDKEAKGVGTCGIEREVLMEQSLAVHFRTFAHADFMQDGHVYELKCVKEPLKAMNTYEAQLQWYYLLGAKRVTLVVQDSAQPFGQGIQYFYIERKNDIVKCLANGIRLVDDAWVSDEHMQVREDIDMSELMPFEQDAVQVLNDTLRTIKVLEQKAADVKRTLLLLMEQIGIKSITNDAFTITYVGESKRKVFDKAKLQTAHPELDLSEYESESTVKPSIKITLK